MVMQRILTMLLCGILHNPSRVAVHAFVAAGSSSSSNTFEERISSGESYSTLTLLEHMHLLSPYVHTKYATHDDINIEEEGSKSMVDLFVQTMGFGLDPKGVDNVKNETGKMYYVIGRTYDAEFSFFMPHFSNKQNPFCNMIYFRSDLCQLRCIPTASQRR